MTVLYSTPRSDTEGDVRRITSGLDDPLKTKTYGSFDSARL